MFTVSIDVSGALNACNGMLAKIDHFKRVDIGAELSDWQTEDLDRHRPFTMRSRSRGRATTVIRPHSRFEVQRSQYAGRQFGRLQKILAKPRKRAYRGAALAYRLYRRWSTRPILRAEMEQKLEERMTRLLEEKIKWE
jgi:hypothetical protein